MNPRSLTLITMSLAAGLLASACGGDDVGIALDQFADRAAPVVCARYFDCCNADELSSELEPLPGPSPTTAAECEQAYATLLAGFVELQEAAIAEGRITYHGDRAAACFDKLAAASCAVFDRAAFLEEEADCLAIFAGQVALGAACRGDDDCAGVDVACEPSAVGQSDVCVQLPGSGEGCTASCAEGFYCGIGAGGGTCQARGADGAPCDGDEQCRSDSCDTSGGSGGSGGTCVAASGPTSCDGL